MERYISTMNFYSCTVSGFEQYAMAAFLEQDILSGTFGD